ncbi:hypothetical protein [Nocardioides daejeonensis]|uniref:hypothetical protein n=1 Tax=Nocardioides daejeonensis TaxID=1046556 RepID=UPI000D7455CE|nr:hypothetical protein [Nocardioides daejeonensis]
MPTAVPGVPPLPERIEQQVAPWFVAVAEGWVLGNGTAAACEIAGRRLAESGVGLDEALRELRATSRLVLGGDPPFGDVQALCRAWSEATLSYLHQISCEDPLTGLATTTHLRTAVAELYRGGFGEPTGVSSAYALVISEIDARSGSGTVMDTALALTRLGEAHRTVFPTGVVGRIGPRRVAALVSRDERLGRRVRLLKQLADSAGRIWIEGLPAGEEAAVLLIDELSRI